MTLLQLIDRVDGILSFPEFSRDFAAGLDLIRPGDPEGEFDAFVARVRGRFETSRNYRVVLQFLQDHSRLTDAELVRVFEFIYSKLVNKFKGEIGEALAARAISEFPEHLGPDVTVIHGSRISQRQLARRGGWYDGADALYCRRDGERFEIVAVAEVKSKTTSIDDILAQVTKVVLRLRRGFRLNGEEIPADRVTIVASGRRVPASAIDAAHAAAVTALILVPWVGAKDGTPVRLADRANVWRAELPYSQDDITEAGYRFMSWYFAKIGPRVFYYTRDGAPSPGDARVPAPHQDLSLEENGGHAFMEAIYHSALRKTFDPKEVPERGHRTAWQTLLWLYNSMGFGYEEASSEELMFPAFDPNPAHRAWLERHDRAMAEYYEGCIGAALDCFPDPAQQTYADWAPREWILLARLRARNGDAAGAREALANLNGDPHQSESLSTRMEAFALDPLIAIAAGEDARAQLAAAARVLDEARETVAIHETRGWGFPANLTPKNARNAIIDFAVASILLANEDDALDALMRLRGCDEGELKLFAYDPVLSRVTQRDGVLDRLRRSVSKTGSFAIF